MARMVDEARSGAEPARSRWSAATAATAATAAWAAMAALSGCVAGPAIPDDPDVLPIWRRELSDSGRIRGAELAPGLPLTGLPRGSAVVVVDPNERASRAVIDDAQRRQLRAFVEAGGRLVLFGHAARLATDLGFEPERPESSVYRWGYDRRAVAGTAELALHFVSGREQGRSGAPPQARPS